MRARTSREAGLARATRTGSLVSCLAVSLLLLVSSFGFADQPRGRAVPGDLLQKAWNTGTVRVIVELGGAGAVPEGHLLSHAAVAAQRGRIAADRAALRSALRGLRHRVLREFKAIPYVSLEADYDTLRVLDSLPGLATRVHEDMLLRPALAQSGPVIKAPDAWAAGWDGTGQVIAIIDSGVDKTHPFLAGKVVEEACYDSSGASTCPNGSSEQTGTGAAPPCAYSPSDCPHGTHVAGIAAGNGTSAGVSFSGVARGAHLMAVRTSHSFDCDGVPCAVHFFSDIVAGLERVYELRETYDFASVNLSIGGFLFPAPCDGESPAMDAAVANLRSAGIATVMSSGNEGDVSQISFPACISSAISVGSTKDGSGPGGTPTDDVSLFSNSAYFLSLLAPGQWITSSVPGGGFAAIQGTSMAAPHVAGAWAIAKQVNPTASVDDILAGLQNTGRMIFDPGNGITFPRIAATLLQFSTATYSATETAATATITVTRYGSMFGPNFAPLTVDYATSANGAVPGQDYEDTSGTLEFNEGDVSKTFTVPIINDTKADGQRKVKLTLSNPGGGALLGLRDTADLNIGDNDVAGSIQFGAATYSVHENAVTGIATITVTRSGGSASPVTVQYTTSDGTGHAPGDYGSTSGTITFDPSGPGATTQTFDVPIVDNGLPDGNRTVNLALNTPGGGAVLGGQKTAVLTIVDNEIAFQFSQASYSVNEGGSATITVTRTGPKESAVGVTYTVLPGSATQGLDYGGPLTQTLLFAANQTTGTFMIPTVNDTLAEGPETVLLQLSAPTGGAILGPRQTAVLTIVDNDPAGGVKFSATGYTTPDADGAAVITVTRTGGTGQGATVKVATGGAGTATPGTHYDPISPTLVPFVGNQPTATFQVTIHGNSVAGDGNKTVELVLSEPGGGAVLGTPNKVFLTITNNDIGGALSFLASSVSVAESNSTATVTVRRTGGAASGVTVDVVATNGTAKLGVDYSPPVPATLTFGPGDTQKTFDVPILANPGAVTSRSLTLKLQNAVGGGTLGSPGTATLTITKAGMRFSQTAYSVNEGSVATITVMRAGTVPGATVSYATEDGNDADVGKNAHAGTDYLLISPTSLSPAFGAGQTSRTFAVTTLNSGAHGNRTLLLHLSNPSGDPLGDPATATLTIFGTSQPELQLTAFSPPELAIIGKSFAVPNTVRNFSGTAAAPSMLQFLLSADATPDAGDLVLGTRAVPALAAGATSAATTTLTIPSGAFPAGAPPGSYRILAVVDVTGSVAEQDEDNNVQSKPLTVISSLVKTFKVSGDFQATGCTSPLRNGSEIVEGTLVFSTQAGKALTGTLTLTSPTTARKTTGPVAATVDEAGVLTGTFTYTRTEGSTVVSKGAGTLAGQTDGVGLSFPFDLTGTHASGETCDFSASLISPAAPWLSLHFQHRAVAGELGEQDGGFVATPDFPVSIESFRALLDDIVDTPLPTLAEVTFTSPGGAVFSDTPAAERTQLATNAGVYRSPFSTSPPTAPSGVWIVHHKGVDTNIETQDPEADERLVVPVPTFVANGSGALSQVTWVLKDPTGALIAPELIPGFLHSLRLQILDPCGMMLHDSQELLPISTSRAINPAIILSRVAEVRFLSVDDRQNISSVHYGGTTAAPCKVVEFSAPAYSVGENGVSASIALRRVGDLTGPLTVRFHTEDGTATAPTDYGSVDIPVTFGPGATTATASIPIFNNGAPGEPKTLHLRLDHVDPGDPNPEMVVGPLGTALLTIKDDEPTLRLNSAAYVVGEASANLSVTILRSGPTAGALSVDLVPQATDTATGGTCNGGEADFGMSSIHVDFAPGQVSRTIPVPICTDARAEGTEKFELALQNPSGATLGNPATATVSLADNEVAGTVRWSGAEVSGVEGTTLLLTVSRTGGTASDVKVFFTAHDGDADTPGADAQSGTDYTVVTPSPLTFGQNATTQTVEISLLPTGGLQGPRAFRVVLDAADSGAALGSPSTITIWILDPS